MDSVIEDGSADVDDLGRSAGVVLWTGDADGVLDGLPMLASDDVDAMGVVCFGGGIGVVLVIMA